MSYKVQSILFKKPFWNTLSSRKWLKTHNYKPIKRVHKTPNYLRYRLRKPTKTGRYHIVDFGDTIKAVIHYR